MVFQPGYFIQNVFPQGYFMENYFPEYGAATPATSKLTRIIEKLEQQNPVTNIWETGIWREGIWEHGQLDKLLDELEKT